VGGLLWQGRVVDGAPTEVRSSIDDGKYASRYLAIVAVIAITRMRFVLGRVPSREAEGEDHAKLD
jgi:hypothetical protein